LQGYYKRFNSDIGSNKPKQNQIIKSYKMELLILIGGCYALYVVGNAIAVNLDYQAVNKSRGYK